MFDRRPMSQRSFSHHSRHGTVFSSDRCDFKNGVKVVKPSRITEMQLCQDFAEFGAFHAMQIHSELTEGFQGYDTIRYTFVNNGGEKDEERVVSKAPERQEQQCADSELIEEVINLLDNTSKTIRDFPDVDSFIEFCDEHGLLFGDDNCDGYTELSLMTVFTQLLVLIMTYDQVIDHYRTLLEANPGKALHIGNENYAFIDPEGNLLGICDPKDGVDLAEAFDLDRSAYNSCLGGWDGETCVDTRAHIKTPSFVDVFYK